MHQNLPQIIYRLELEIKLLGINNKLVRKYNAIDHELIDSIWKAARKAIEHKQHGNARSPALTQAGTAVIFWKSVLTSKLHYIPAKKMHMI